MLGGEAQHFLSGLVDRAHEQVNLSPSREE
jgi:hypothetical protein